MDKLKKYSKWIRIFHIFAFVGLLVAAGINLVKQEPAEPGRDCSGESQLLDYKCWAEKHASNTRQTERAGIKSVYLWLPLFAISMFGLWNFIGLMGSFQHGQIFSNENFHRMRWIGRTYLCLFFVEGIYISLTQLIAKLLVPNLPEFHFRVATGSSSDLMAGLLFLIMAYAVEAAVQMKQELEEVV